MGTAQRAVETCAGSARVGEAIIAATQQTDVADSLIANSGTKIILRTDYPKDVDFASKLLQIDVRWLAKIPLGQGIARLPTRYYQPFLFSFPDQPLKNQLVPDTLVRERYAQWAGPTEEVVATPTLPDRPAAVLRPREQDLLVDVAGHPISTVTERYARLGWNPKTGNAVKDAVIHAGLAEFHTIEAGRTRIKLLTLTASGEGVVREAGGAIRRSGRAGMEHEFWRSRLRERCEARGYTVTEEFHLGDGKRVDLRAQRGETVFLFEVETGRSDVLGNIAKCAGRGNLIVFFTNAQAFAASRATLPADVITLIPESLSRLHDLLS